MDKAESEKSPKVAELRVILQALREDHKEHVEKHNIQYAHSCAEFYRVGGSQGPVLKTSVFMAGDVKRARNPVKTDGKKSKRKKKKTQEENPTTAHF